MWQREGLGKKCKDVVTILAVDPATLSRIITRFRETGHVMKKRHPTRRAFRKLTKDAEMMILHIALCRPGIYLHEIVKGLSETLGVDISLSSICIFLKKFGFTRQNLRITAIQQDRVCRLQMLYDQDMMIFLDETDCDRHNMIRRYGYSIRSRPLVSEKFSSSWQKNINHCLHVSEWDP